MENKQTKKQKSIASPFFARRIIVAAISLALLPNTSYAGIKPKPINNLPQYGEISDIRAGKALNGILSFGWKSGDQIYIQDIASNGGIQSEAKIADSYDSIVMDDDGDFSVSVTDTGKLSVQDINNASIEVNPSKQVSNYGFDEGNNPNKSVTFNIVDPIITQSSTGDFVVLWKETQEDATRKSRQVCSTDEYGGKECYPEFTYKTNRQTSLFAQRYNHQLVAIDAHPWKVANTKGQGAYINDVSVKMDQDGDFVVAYAKGLSKTTSSGDGYGEDTVTVDNSEIFAKQFTNNTKKKFSGGKEIRLSAKPKLPKGHKVKNSTNKEPAITITDNAKNSFIIIWHNDYEDHYKVANREEGCIKYKTVRDEYGYSSKECVKYGYKTVFSNESDKSSILKAIRFSH